MQLRFARDSYCFSSYPLKVSTFCEHPFFSEMSPVGHAQSLIISDFCFRLTIRLVYIGVTLYPALVWMIWPLGIVYFLQYLVPNLFYLPILSFSIYFYKNIIYFKAYRRFYMSEEIGTYYLLIYHPSSFRPIILGQPKRVKPEALRKLVWDFLSVPDFLTSMRNFIYFCLTLWEVSNILRVWGTL